MKKWAVVFLVIFQVAYINSETIVVFSPHPDDDVIGCGGSIIQHVNKGDHVTIVYLTSGEAAPWKGKRSELLRIREQEAADAAGLMGVRDLIFLKEPDSHLQVTEKNQFEVLRIIHKIQPDCVYVTHNGEAHRDHKAAFQIVTNAIKVAMEEGLKKPEILCYEVWPPMSKLSLIRDISNEFEQKLEALKKHKSQIAHTNYVDAIEGLNRYRGIMTRRGNYVECFQKI